jgi:putative ABC transport system substrate-binding protein
MSHTLCCGPPSRRSVLPAVNLKITTSDDPALGARAGGRSNSVTSRRACLTGTVAAFAAPLAAHAQQPAAPVIGFLSSRSSDESAHLMAAVRHGLSETGYVEGKNLTIEYRWAEGNYERLPALASDLVRQKVAVIIAGGGAVSADAAKGATSSIPIVFVSGADPVRYGLVTSLGRPGANATGVTMFVGELSLKRLELLRELVPHVGLIGVLINHKSLEAETQSKNMQAAANLLRQRILLSMPEVKTSSSRPLRRYRSHELARC